MFMFSSIEISPVPTDRILMWQAFGIFFLNALDKILTVENIKNAILSRTSANCSVRCLM